MLIVFLSVLEQRLTLPESSTDEDCYYCCCYFFGFFMIEDFLVEL